MDAMKYLGDLAKRNPNMRLGKALEKLAIAAKAEELREEVRTSRSSQQGAEIVRPRREGKSGAEVGWLVDWEKNRDAIQEAIVKMPAGTEFTGTPVIQCPHSAWAAVPESYDFRGPSQNMVAECTGCGFRGTAYVTDEPLSHARIYTLTPDPNAPAGNVIFDRTPADVTLPADADTERLDVYGI